MSERDFIALIDGTRQLVRAPIVLVWDRLNTHVSHAMRELIAERAWLTVFLLPAYAPDLNPVEWVWAHVKRSLANLAVVALDRLEALVRNRLERLQYRPGGVSVPVCGVGLRTHGVRPLIGVVGVASVRVRRAPAARPAAWTSAARDGTSGFSRRRRRSARR